MIDPGASAAARAARRAARRRRRLSALVGAVAAVCVTVVLVVLLTRPDHHVTVVRVVVAGPAAVDDPRPTLTNAQGDPARPLAPTPQQAAARAATAPPQATPQTPATSAPASAAPVLRAGASASFRRLSASLPGRVELAVSPLGTGATIVLGGDSAAHGWSTTKVPVLVALLRARGRSGLTAQERVWASAAITASDNQSILDLFGDLEQLEGGLGGASGYIDAVLRLSGDDQTVVATGPPPPGAVTTFGQTEWSPSQSLKFFRGLARGCLLPTAQTGYVLGLMENIEASESWGLGSGHFGVPVAFKGGWGPEPSGSYLVRQSGVIDAGSSRGVAVTIVAFPSQAGSGSFPAGTQIVTQTAQWLQGELRLTPHPRAGCSTQQGPG